MSTHRDAKDVVESHLRLRREGDVETDIQRNFSPDVVLLTGTGVYRSHDGVRASADELSSYLGEATFEYTNVLIEDQVGFLEWTAKGSRGVVRDGADSFVVEDGLIAYQTIHYTVEEP